MTKVKQRYLLCKQRYLREKIKYSIAITLLIARVKKKISKKLSIKLNKASFDTNHAKTIEREISIKENYRAVKKKAKKTLSETL